MTPAAQAKFLRVLQEREFLRLGGTRPVPVKVRIIAATNRDLDDSVARGEFRVDLYYRLNVIDIRIPPLRERRDDIPLLAAGFLREFSGAAAELTADAMEALRGHDWPGNVRELRNVLERAVILSDGRFIGAEHPASASQGAFCPAGQHRRCRGVWRPNRVAPR
jgi:transcriptional regulator with GAF, ATPase, and Fis domain